MMNTARRMKLIVGLFLFLAFSTSIAKADVISVGPGAFSGAPITFTGIPNGTEVNGLTVGGITFTHSLGNNRVTIGSGPGVTNNVNPPNIASVQGTAGILTLTLSVPATALGYGYSVLNLAPLANATTITLFSGATNVGSLAYNGALDPIFAGGFAGIQSTTPFDSVQITFSAGVPAFALDNIVVNPIPEPTTMLLLGSGLIGIAAKVRRRRKGC